MSEIWTSIIESQIYANIVSEFSETIKAEYPSLKFTTQEEDLSEANLPMVYIHLLPMMEIGNDLENTEVNAVSATFQVDVNINTTKYDANIIANEVMRIFKKMAFSIEQFPFTIQQGTVIRSVLRANRAIGSGDTI